METMTKPQNEIQTRNDYGELVKNIEAAIKESKAVIVLDEVQVDKAGFYIKNFRKLDKSIESLRKSIVDPLNKEVKSINQIFKDLALQYADELNRLTNEVNEFLQEKRRMQEEQRQKEQAELEDALIDEAEMFDDEAVLDNIPKVEFKREGLGDISTTVTTMRAKKWKVIDIDKVPRKYLILDEALISRTRKEHDFEDKSPIDGIEFFVEETIRTK